MIVIAYDRLPDLLQQEVDYLNTLTLKLFVNNVILTGNTIADNLDVPSDSGYAAVTDVGFSAAFRNGDDQGETNADPVVFTFDHDAGDFTIYGYYFADPVLDGEFVFGENAETPFEVTSAGQTYTVVPRKLMQAIPPA